MAVRQSLKSGDVITASDIEIIKGSPSDFVIILLRRSFIGRKLKRRLGIGKIARASHLEADWMVREGQPVILKSQFGQVQVRREAGHWKMPSGARWHGF